MSDDTRPCDTEDHDNVRPIPAKPDAKVLSMGSFSPAWDAERKARNAQQQLRHDLANAFRSTEAAGKYDPVTDDGTSEFPDECWGDCDDPDCPCVHPGRDDAPKGAA